MAAKQHHILRIVCLSALVFLLVACNSVYHPLIPDRKTAKHLAVGTAAGAGVGAITASIGTAGGSVLGGMIGGYSNSIGALETRMHYMGANIIHLGDTTTIIIPADDFFDPKDDLLKNDIYNTNHPLLNLVARYLIKFGNSVVKVAVSTDDVDTRKRNYLLSKRQAHRVTAYLYRRGVSSWRLYPLAYGPDYLVASNRTVRGSKENRNIIISTNPRITPADDCNVIQHFLKEPQAWEFWGYPY